MGGQVVRVSLSPTDPAKPISLPVVGRVLWEEIWKAMHFLLKRPADRLVLGNEYLVVDVVAEWEREWVDLAGAGSTPARLRVP
jgi:hypothetical protein